MFPMNNPMATLANAARSGNNVLPMMQQIAGNDPRFNGFMKALNSGGNLEEIARNTAKTSGIDLAQFASQFGFSIK